MNTVHIVGGGLAGSEAAWQCLQLGLRVVLHEMRPERMTPAHQTGRLAELVCSNSLKSMAENSAPGLLKHDMTKFNSLVLEAAYKAQVPAGQALAVNREIFSSYIETMLEQHPSFTRVYEEVSSFPTEDELSLDRDVWILATGPLTSSSLSEFLDYQFEGQKRLYFYDAIAPVLEAESIDTDQGFWADRWDEDQGKQGSYFNIPLNKDQYYAFVDAVIAAEKMPLHDFEEPKYFESCLPIEVMIERGRETLRFGPMKPVGLTDPKTGRWAYATLQMRKENLEGTMLSLVGFQTKMKWPEQKRVFSMLPGLSECEFYRYGSVHRNTFVNGPVVLQSNLALKKNKRVFLAGQITGVEGYTESAAIGLLAGRFAAATLLQKPFQAPPKTTMLGALHDYVTVGPAGVFQPMNANLGLLTPVPKSEVRAKDERKALQCSRAKSAFDDYLRTLS
jgi:methylenetetrahydrofolate--tRNA-(uracil-5-)-methyltransferase